MPNVIDFVASKLTTIKKDVVFGNVYFCILLCLTL